MWNFIRVIALGGCLFAMVGNSAYAEPLSAEKIRALLNGNTWKIGLRGSFTESRLVHFWDWKPDGSVCGRLGGAKKGESCADVGKWRLEGNRLCWQYTWFNAFGYYKAGCFHIEGADEGKYLANSEKTGNLVFAFFVVE